MGLQRRDQGLQFMPISRWRKTIPRFLLRLNLNKFPTNSQSESGDLGN